jgi:hypothetical protein
MVRGTSRKWKDAPSTAGSSTHSHAFSLGDLDARPEDAPIATTVHRISEDHRRVYIADVPVQPLSPVKRMRRDAQAPPEDPPPPLATTEEFLGYSVNHERYEISLFDDDDGPPLLQPPPAAKKGPRTVKPAVSFFSSFCSLFFFFVFFFVLAADASDRTFRWMSGGASNATRT